MPFKKEKEYTHNYGHILANTCTTALFMKGNVCIGMVMKCSGSRMAHLTLPERKRVKVMRKGGAGLGVRRFSS